MAQPLRPFRSLALPRPDPWWLCAALLASIPILALLRPGLPNTADGQVHLLRTWQVVELLRAGILYPRWAPDFYFGYGYPFFNFYAPGAHLLAGLIALSGAGILRAVVALQVLALLLYPTGAYLAARTLFDGHEPRRAAPAALVSAALYLYAPLRFRELFVQGNLSQLLALGLLPWAAWALGRAARSGSLRWAAMAGAMLAGLVYAHHATAFLAFPLLGVYGLGLALIFGADGHAAVGATANEKGHCEERSDEAVSGLRGRRRLLRCARNDLHGAIFRAGSWAGINSGLRFFRAVTYAAAGATGGRIVATGVALALGVLISAGFWLPALAEMADVNIGAIEAGMFNARLNLVPLADLLAPTPVLDDAALNPPMPHNLGLAQALLAGLGTLGAGIAAGLSWATRRRGATADENLRSNGLSRSGQPGATACPGGQAREVATTKGRIFREGSWAGINSGLRFFRAALLLTGLLLLCLALMTPPAAPLWEHLPLGRLIAFPWRLLGPALLWAALLGGVVLLAVPKQLITPVLLLLLVLIPLSVATYLFPRPFAPASEPGAADLARYELAGGARGTASANEYLPRWVSDPNPPPVMTSDYLAGRPPDRLDRESLPPGSRAQALVQAPLTDVYRLDLPAEARLTLRRFYFPGWRAWLDGRPVPLTPDDRYGLIQVTVPAGTHELRLEFGATGPRQAGAWLTWGGIVAAAVLAWRRPRPRSALSDTPERNGDARRTARLPLLASAALILLLTGAKTLAIEPHTRWFRWKSPVDAPATMQQPVHARFANGVELIGYDLPRGAVRQGDTLDVRLYWRPLRPQSTDVRPFLHLDAVTGEVTWANQTRLHAGDKPSSGWPLGFYVVDDYRLAVPADAPPVVGMLRAGLLTGDSQRIPLEDGTDIATLGPVRITERHPMRVTVPSGFGGPYRLGSGIRLVSYRAEVTGMPPLLALTLYWQADAPPTRDYTVFVHVLDGADHRVAQGDGPPWHGWYPTSAWAPGQVIPDQRQIVLPADVRPTDLRLAVGLYSPTDGARLNVTDAAGNPQPEDRVLLPLVSDR